MLILCYPKCTTCQKAKRWLNEHGIEYTERHIVEENPTYDELKSWYQQSGLPLKKFFNTSGLVYKEMQLKDRLSSMSEEEQLKLLADFVPNSTQNWLYRKIDYTESYRNTRFYKEIPIKIRYNFFAYLIHYDNEIGNLIKSFGIIFSLFQTI